MTHQLELAALERDWIDRSVPLVLERMRGREFCSDDLHLILAAPEHDNWHGVLMARLRNTGLIERVGYKPSERKERNGGIISVWKLK